jgi:ribonuclease P protein component
MLSAKNRLKHERDIGTVFELGKGVSGKYIFIKYWKVDSSKYPNRRYGQDELKIAFVVGKKVSKSAVKRNLIKRRMRAIVLDILSKTPQILGYHIVVSAKPGVEGVTYDDITHDIDQTIEKMRRYVS